MNKKKERIDELDALRGIAALFVVFFHYTMGRPEAKLGFKLGATGVDLFFIISGFVIFMSLNKITNSTQFVINRISRLYPAYWATVTITFLLMVVYSLYKSEVFFSENLLNYFGNMTMCQFYFNIPNLDGPYWTMIIELLFYIIMLVLFHYKILKYLNLFGIATIIIEFILLNPFWNHTVLVNQILYWIPIMPFIPLFFAGTVFYKVFISNNYNLYKNYFLLFFCMISQICLFEYIGVANKYITSLEYSIMIIIYFILFILFVNHKLNFIVSKPTLFLGKISFSLYLIHQYVSNGFIIPILINKFNFNFWIASLFIAFPIVVGLASFITFYIEIPVGKFMKEKLTKKYIKLGVS